MSSHSSHHPQEVLLAQFSLYVHKGGLKPDSFHLIGGKSSGPDKTPNLILKNAANAKKKIVDASLQTGKLPDDWESIVPVLK